MLQKTCSGKVWKWHIQILSFSFNSTFTEKSLVFWGCAFSTHRLSQKLRTVFSLREISAVFHKNVKMKTRRWISVSLSTIFLRSVTLWMQKWNVKVQHEPYETLLHELPETTTSGQFNFIISSACWLCVQISSSYTHRDAHTASLPCWPFWKLQYLS